MKAERRHELKHNELSDWLGERMEMMKPHATGILLGIALLAAIVIGSYMYLGGETAASSRAWSRYFQSFSQLQPQKSLQELAEEQSGSKAAWWAVIAVGDMNLGEGAALLFTDRSEAQKRLEAAKEAYKKVEFSDDPMLKTRARLGLAKVNESLFQPKEALKYYEQVAATEKESAIGKAAAAGANRMKNASEVAFLEWFAAQTPKRPAPFPGMGGSVPGLPNELPDRPTIDLPKGLGLDNVGTGAPPDATPTLPSPAGAVPPTTPLEVAPPDATKTGDAKPADAPAATTPTAAPPAVTLPPVTPPDSSEKKSD